MRAPRTSGLTLIEVLVGAALALLVLLIVAQGLQVGGGATARIVSRAELLDDTRVAGQLIADEAARAVLIYPPGTRLALNERVSALTRNPTGVRTGSNVWIVGTDPIVAFVTSPVVPPDVARCDPEGSATARAACAEFVAFYAVHRGRVVAVTRQADGTERSSSPGDDPLNKDSWLIYEYRKALPMASLVPRSGVPSAAPLGPPLLTGVTPDLVADHIEPGGFSVHVSGCRDAWTLPASCGDPAPLGAPLASVVTGGVTIRAGLRRGRGRVILPELTVPIVPGRLY